MAFNNLAQAAWEDYYSEQAFIETGTVLPVAFCSDANGGQTFIATCFKETSGPKIYVKKYSRTGNPLWGESGVPVPVDINNPSYLEPLTMVTDFDGGVYVAFRQLYGTQYIVSLVRFDRDGHLAWYRPVGDFMDYVDGLQIHLAADNSTSPGCFVAWSQHDTSTYPERVLAAFVDKTSGTVDWQVDTGFLVYLNFPDHSGWDIATDGQAGLLVSSTDDIQRLDHQGNLLWGTGGTTLQGVGGHLGGLIADGTGGAFVLTHHLYGQVTGQHVSAAGINTWGSAGIIFSPIQGYQCRVSFCTDQAGGFFFITGYEDLVGQRVDSGGNKLWGASGITLTSLAGWQTDPNMVSDGAGGFLLVYKDHYYNENAISAMRVDASGNNLWQKDAAYWDYTNWDQVWEPLIVSDGWGGAAFAFKSQPLGESWQWIGIGSLGNDGANPPVTTLAYCDPPYGVMDWTNLTTIHGQYLDSTNSYVFAGNGDEFYLGASTLGPNGDSLTGELDLAGAQTGAYDLICRYYSTDVSLLTACYGVGEPVECAAESEISGACDSYDISYGPRSSAVADDGAVLHAWLMQSKNSQPSRLMVWKQGQETGDLVYQTTDAISDLAFFATADNDRYFAFISDDGTNQDLVYMHNSTILSLVQPAVDISHCALAANAEGEAMIVFQAWNTGLNAYVLNSVLASDAGFGPVVDLAAGYNAMAPDVVATDVGYVVTYMRDLWFPGAREVCYQEFSEDTWSSPVGLNFAWSVTSPTVAWDGLDDLLFSYVLDNYTGEQGLFTSHVQAGTVDPAVRVKGAPYVGESLVSGAGDDLFYLLSLTGDGSGFEDLHLHRCDTQVAYPPKALGVASLTFLPTLASNSQGQVSSFRQMEDPLSTAYQFIANACGQGPFSAGPLPELAAPLAAHPNPFNPQTTLVFSLARPDDLTLDLYDLQGRRLRRLHQGALPAGKHEFIWDGRDNSGRRMASGVYFARLKGSRSGQTVKIALVK